MPPHVSAMDLVILCRCMLLVNWTLCLYQPGAGMRFVSGSNCYLSRTSAICCTFPMVGETKLSKSWRQRARLQVPKWICADATDSGVCRCNRLASAGGQ